MITVDGSVRTVSSVTYMTGRPAEAAELDGFFGGALEMVYGPIFD